MMIRILALLLTVVTGASGLVYEVTWQRYLATLLGSHSEATAALLGIFLFGLSLGYSLFGVVTRRVVARAARAGRPPRLLALYGAVEAGIGVYAFLFPWLFAGVQRVSFALPHFSPGLGFAIDVLLCAALVLPPTILMGGTIPMLTQALSKNLDDATRFHALVYAFNTAGAFVGALAAGWYLIPAFGLSAVMIGVSATNIAAGTLFVLLGAVRRGGYTGEESRAPAGPIAGAWLFLTVALLGGFAMMALQTVLIRVGGLAIGSSGFTFAMVVAVFVLCIAIGSLTVSLVPNIRPGYLVASQWGLAAILLALYKPIGLAPYGLYVLRTFFRDTPSAFYPFYVSAFLTILVTIGPAVILSGALLPLLFHALRRESGELGAMAGRLYSWNTVGSLLGAILGGYVLLVWTNLDDVYLVSVAAVIVSALLLTWRLTPVPPTALGALALSSAAALWMLGGWDERTLSSGIFRIRWPLPMSYQGPKPIVDHFFGKADIVAFYDDDPTSTVTVGERHHDDGSLERRIVTNGKVDGGTRGDYPTMGLAADLPAIVADAPERAFVIGLGTGVTAGELARIDSIKSVEVAEISSGVIAAAPLFDFANGDLTKSPKVKLLRSDAYRALRRSEGGYDVIISEPSNPWVAGVEMLFSREFLEAARDRLRPGGVYCQWMHQYETDDAMVALVLRTYASVFDDIAIWYGVGPDLLILGRQGERDPATDLARIEERFKQRDYAASFQRSGVRTLPELLAHELVPFGVVRELGLKGPIHTLFHPILSHMGGIAFFAGGGGMLPRMNEKALEAARESSLLTLYAARFGGDLPDAERALVTRELCPARAPECTALLADWLRVRPDSPEFKSVFDEVKARGLTQWDGAVQPNAVVRLAKVMGSRSGSGTPDDEGMRTKYYHPGLPALRATNGSASRADASAAAAPQADGRARFDGD